MVQKKPIGVVKNFQNDAIPCLVVSCQEYLGGKWYPLSNGSVCFFSDALESLACLLGVGSVASSDDVSGFSPASGAAEPFTSVAGDVAVVSLSILPSV